MVRKLAAILAADIVGYSKMMGADEAATLAALSKLRHEIFEPLIGDHHGIVIKRLGDGWLVEFTSALDAVNCAISVQEKLVDHKSIKLRIGVHIGDVTQDDEGDIHGDGVNIAARLEGVAEACGIAISDQVYNSLDGTMTPAFEDGGEHELKNIARRIRVWNWVEATANGEVTLDNGENSVPIILLEPFSLGGDEGVADDIVEELQSSLLDALSNRSGIKVATPTKNTATPTYLLKGRCRVSGARCRLHVSIVVAANGETVWTTKINGEIDDVFGFVDDVVVQVGNAMRVQINSFAGAMYVTQPDERLTLQQLLAKAAHLFFKADAKNAALSRNTMAAAETIAPENPMALAMRAYAIMQTIPLAIERTEDIDVEAVMSLADKAVYHGPNVDYAFHQRARIRLWLRNDHEGCASDARRALAINPDYQLAHEDLLYSDIFGGKPDLGVLGLERMIEKFPNQPMTPYRLSILGVGNALVGNMKDALKYALEGYERKPLVPLHAIAYAIAGSADAAVHNSDEFRKMIHYHGLSVRDADRFPFSREKDTATIASMLERSGLPKMSI